jgi:acid phosphatase
MFNCLLRRAAVAAIFVLVANNPSALADESPPPLGCSPKPAIQPEDFAQPLNLDILKTRLIYYRCTSYDADVSKVLDEALSWVKMRAPAVIAAGDKPAIILDIDETALSNWTRIYRDQFAYFADGDCEISDNTKLCGDSAWQRSGRATAIMPTRNLYKFARCIDVLPPCTPIDVFFITGRRELGAPVDGKTPREWTRDNLLAAGYVGAADNHLFLRPNSEGGVADYKSGTRARIEANFRVHIIANVGDQLSDLEGGYAERPFKVPNPFYFIPSR